VRGPGPRWPGPLGPYGPTWASTQCTQTHRQELDEYPKLRNSRAGRNQEPGIRFRFRDSQIRVPVRGSYPLKLKSESQFASSTLTAALRLACRFRLLACQLV
jgi:hypothetical protein